MSRDTLKIHVAVKNLQIGGANAGEVNLDESGLTVAKSGATASRPYDLRFLGRWGIGYIEAQFMAIPVESLHCFATSLAFQFASPFRFWPRYLFAVNENVRAALVKETEQSLNLRAFGNGFHISPDHVFENPIADLS